MAKEHAVHLHITSGQGPGECRQAVGHFLGFLEKEAVAAGLEIDIATAAKRASHGPASAVVAVYGQGAEAFIKPYLGSILWVAKSQIRPNHKRQNWFIGVYALAPAAKVPKIAETELRFDRFRAGGPGGQHQNTTESAVRVTHLPTGLSAVARDERSQHRNKALALERLQAQLGQWQAVLEKDRQQTHHALNHSLERGSPVMVFRGPKFERS